ncbi:PleD family two-component system response regulator [Pseudomonadota bacterium]
MSDNTVLVACDSPTQKLYLEQLLRKDGFNVLTATDGQSVLEITATEHIEFLVMDVVMPDMDGFDVCWTLKNDAITKEIPVILISSKFNQRTLDRALRVGAQAYISKADVKRDLLGCIDRLTNNGRETSHTKTAASSA